MFSKLSLFRRAAIAPATMRMSFRSIYHKTESDLPGRIVPKLPTFYSANPNHEDRINRLERLLRKYIKLPSQNSTEVQQTKAPWISFDEYALIGGGTRLKPTQYTQLLYMLNKLHNIDSQLTNDEITKNKVCKWEAQKELEKLKLENSKLIQLKHEHLLQKQEIVSLKAKLESVNKRNNDLISDMKKSKDNGIDEKMRECTFMNENENEDVTIPNTGPGVLELNVNETSKKLTQATFKPSKYLPRETRNNETRLKYLEKKVFGLEKSLEKKKKTAKD